MIVGIGVGENNEKILNSINSVRDKVRIRIFTSLDLEFNGTNPEIHKCENPEEALIDALYDKSIDAAVRGTLPANKMMKNLKRHAGVSSLERAAIIETSDGTRFLLAPVGVDEGWTVDEKISFINASRPVAKKFGINDRVAVLSGGRTGDLGRHKIVDKTITDAIEIAEKTGADHCEILIEDAVRQHGIIIAPDGISGNLIFRTLALLGDGNAHGAPVLNIDRIFVDTSRANKDYSNAILIAESLAKK
ncbi:phosphotransacetylase [Methanoplanus sp. FWC-SCC4]|uniref:Phosphotransacetylase n=1 Tax=Methanochimaera problematica TaxID=2609417 RepID=A0AA97FAB3_9EURY|nr:phosphotransacetylase [Methanoplanus sp. FWC-SCC4]